jgi:hypothetical protein
MVVCFNPKFGGGRFGSESKRNLGGKSKWNEHSHIYKFLCKSGL